MQHHNHEKTFWSPPWGLKQWSVIAAILVFISAITAQPPHHINNKTRGSSPTYVEADFYWDEHTTPYKDIIIKGANKVLHDNNRCEDIDPGTVDVSQRQGTKDDPQFFVYCKTRNGEYFTAYWSKSDIEKGTSLSAAKNPNHDLANQVCKEQAIASVRHPSSVNYKMWEANFKDWPNGRTRVETTFTAKNSFGVTIKHTISCLYQEDRLIDLVIKEIG